MSPAHEARSPGVKALVHTTDVDESLAGFRGLSGFGSFEIPISGPVTAIVGRNGSGKTRFLASIGAQTELVFEMPLPQHWRLSTDDPEVSARLPSGLWGLAPVPDGYTLGDHSWVTPDPTGWDVGEYSGVRSIWQEHPRDRFHHFLRLLSGTDLAGSVAVALQSAGDDVPRQSPHQALETELLASQFVADVIAKVARASAPIRHLAAYAATAMYPSDHWVGRSVFADLFLAGVGIELAEFSRIGVTGARTNDSQRIRFYFQVDSVSAPGCTAIVQGHEQGRESGTKSTEPPSLLQRLADFAENLESICYASADAGLEPVAGSTWRFTPQLPLQLDGSAGVLHEGETKSLWLEGVTALPQTDDRWRSILGVRNARSDDWGAVSWRFSSPRTDLAWLEDLEPDENDIIDLGAPLTEARLAREAEWQSRLIHTTGRPTELVFGFTDEVLGICERAVRAVNAVASVLVVDPPVALLDPCDGALRWRFIKHGPLPQSPTDLLKIDDLSFGEQRWMRFANLIASRMLDRVLSAYGSDADREWIDSGAIEALGPGVFLGSELVVVIDEPEAGLHPTAIDRLARGLRELAETLRIHFVLATHSPNVLRIVQAASGTIAHSHVNLSGERVFQAINTAELSTFAQDLGMNSVDLLQMTSTFLLVEGEHDRIVINNLIGEEIRRSGVVTTPLRGALKVSQIVDSDLVWRFTDARLVLVLDSIDAEQMSGIVATAKRHVAEGDTRSAIDSLDPLKRDRTSKGKTEREALYELLRAAVAAHRIDRLEIFGLEEPDIIDYFHPRELGPVSPNSEYLSLGRREAWDLLHAKYMNTPKKERKDVGFKSWAVDVLGVGTDPSEVLRSASASLDRIPDDFIRLRDLLCSVKPQHE